MFFRILIALAVLASPTMAQQPQSQPPPPPPSDAQKAPAKDEKDNPNEKKPEPAQGKSKLERETGTVNDRIFEVLPNYGTVENAKELPPFPPVRNFGLPRPPCSIGGPILSTARSRPSIKPRMNQNRGDRAGELTGNDIAHLSQTTALARI